MILECFQYIEQSSIYFICSDTSRVLYFVFGIVKLDYRHALCTFFVVDRFSFIKNSEYIAVVGAKSLENNYTSSAAQPLYTFIDNGQRDRFVKITSKR